MLFPKELSKVSLLIVIIGHQVAFLVSSPVHTREQYPNRRNSSVDRIEFDG